MSVISNSNSLRTLIRWGLYPTSWIVVLSAFHLIHSSDIPARTIWAVYIGFLAITYLFIEWRFPYEKRWAMSLKSFFSDFKFAIVNSMFIAGLVATLSFFTISLSAENIGVATYWPEPVQLLACLLIFEALNYCLHRAMHEGKGWLGQLLWKIHAAHHLPPRLYLVMHAVFHPINGIIIQSIAIIIPIWWMGYNQHVVTMFLIINGFHGLISHFNVDVRMGWLNYLFVGPELHRYHHSADVNEAKNFGATLSIYDWMFGTFVYRPGVPPKELGVDASTGLPSYDRTFEVLKLPFQKG